jgi:hypothetical protein
MNIESITQLSTNYNASLPKEPPVIDEKAIKSILYLCIQGGEVIFEGNKNPLPAEDHTIDTFA